jgi:hypothetical protein
VQEPGQQTPTSQQRAGSQRAGSQREHLAGRGGRGGTGPSQLSRGARAAADGGGMGGSDSGGGGDGGDGDFQPPSQRQGPRPGRLAVGGRRRGRGPGPRPPLPPPPDYSGVPDPAGAPPAGKVKHIVMENFVVRLWTKLMARDLSAVAAGGCASCCDSWRQPLQQLACRAAIPAVFS